MWRLETKNLAAGVSHLIVDDHGVIALVKKRGRVLKAGPVLAAAPRLLVALRQAQAALETITAAGVTKTASREAAWDAAVEAEAAARNAIAEVEAKP